MGFGDAGLRHSPWGSPCGAQGHGDTVPEGVSVGFGGAQGCGDAVLGVSLCGLGCAGTHGDINPLGSPSGECFGVP